MDIQKISLVCALALGLSGCTTLDGKKLEQSITDGMKEKGVVIKKISCPNGITLKKGVTFECKGEDEAGTEAVFEGSWESGTDVEWKLKGKYADFDALKKAIAEEGKIDAKSIKCPDHSMILTKGSTFACSFPDGPKTATITYTYKGKDGEGFDTKVDEK